MISGHYYNMAVNRGGYPEGEATPEHISERLCVTQQVKFIHPILGGGVLERPTCISYNVNFRSCCGGYLVEEAHNQYVGFSLSCLRILPARILATCLTFKDRVFWA